MKERQVGSLALLIILSIVFVCIGYVVFVICMFGVRETSDKAGRQTEQTTPGRQITPDSVHVHQTQTTFLFPLCSRLITLVFVSQITSLFDYFVQAEAMVQPNTLY